MDEYLPHVRRFGTMPQEYLPHFESLITRFASMHWQHLMSHIAIYGSLSTDYLAYQSLAQGLILLSYTHICAKNW